MISPLTSLLSLVIMSPGYGALKEQPPRGLRISLLAAVPHLSQWRFFLQLPTDQSEEDTAHQKIPLSIPKSSKICCASDATRKLGKVRKGFHLSPQSFALSPGLGISTSTQSNLFWAAPLASDFHPCFHSLSKLIRRTIEGPSILYPPGTTGIFDLQASPL